jgi:hypothetical protein
MAWGLLDILRGFLAWSWTRGQKMPTVVSVGKKKDIVSYPLGPMQSLGNEWNAGQIPAKA